jgi:ParB family transcriptional regulator, chromosome partitioning protein
VQISTAYGQQQEGGATLPRNKYTEIRPEKPTTKEEATRPEFKTCKYTTEAIVSDGIDKGELRKVCPEPTCPVHHPKKQSSADDAKWKTEQEKQRKEAAIANTTGIRVLAAIAAAVPVRLMKRDLFFLDSQLAELVGEGRLETIAKQHGIKRSKEAEKIGKLFAAYLSRADEGTLSRVAIELTIILAASRANASSILREAATVYKVDTDAIAQKVKAEFAAKAKAKKQVRPAARTQSKAKKAA